jgi:heme/copper-type cytochrome/quinol oxidase subunit 2
MKRVLTLCLLAFSVLARAEDAPLFRLELRDGAVVPQRLEVPAGKPFRLEIRNTGKIAGEFECKPLKKEKVVVPGATAVLVFTPVQPGEYKFVEEFHENLPTGQGLIVAK